MDVEFKNARDAMYRGTKRRILQRDLLKRKSNAIAFTNEELKTMIESFDENGPDGLQKKIFKSLQSN